MIITFLGHASITQHNECLNKIEHTILQNISSDKPISFYCGGYGDFDNLCARACRHIQKEYSNCELIFVTPYLNRSREHKFQTKIQAYDTTIYPPLEGVPYRFAIIKRNEWMIDQADLIIAYIQHHYGGAYRAYAYAQKKKKAIINLAK